MELHHEFTVPVPVDEAWRALVDIERVAPCLPGATVEEYDGRTVTGSVKVKVGPVTVTYRGSAVFEQRDEAAHRMVLAARGRETRGQGTARATVTATCVERGGGTAVAVNTDLSVTGRPAQFGRGVLGEVGDRLVGEFAQCLSRQLTGAAPQALGEAGQERVEHVAEASAQASVRPARKTTEPEPISVLRTAGLPLARRAAVVAAGAAVVVLVVVCVRRLRHS